MGAESNVFLSYTEDTRPLAEELARFLEQQGTSVWADFKDLRPGQFWKEELKSAVANANSFVILIGRDGRTSRWQEAEWEAALAGTWADQNKRILPVVVAEGEVPPFLRNWVGLRIHPGDEPSSWTSKVWLAIASLGDQPLQNNPSASLERQARWEKVSRAVEALRVAGPQEPPHASLANLE